MPNDVSRLMAARNPQHLQHRSDMEVGGKLT